MSDSLDKKYMQRALFLAEKAWGQTSPNPMVGAVIVKENKIIGKGFHQRAGEAHAEINALNSCSANPENSTIYVTLEPCSTYGKTPPCTEALINAKIKQVIIGCLDPNPEHAGRAVKILEEANIKVRYGIEKEACLKLNEAFFHWITTQKPFVILKMAMTLDGKIATYNGESKWITGEVAREHVQHLRKWADAIMVGGETARADKPSLTVRTKPEWKKQPQRLIFSRSGKSDEFAQVLPVGNIPQVVSAESEEDWDKLLLKLGSGNITSLLIEGGGELASKALYAKAVNKIEFHIAPKILGGKNSRSVVGGFNPEKLIEAIDLVEVEVEKLGDDICVSGYIK